MLSLFDPSLGAAGCQTNVEQQRPNNPVPRGNETILVVDDDPMVRGLTRHLLQRHGYRVLEAEDGQSAMDVWADNREAIKLLLTDLYLSPAQTGAELAEIIRRRNPSLKVIITSGMDVEGQEASRDLSIPVTFVAKPFQPVSLLELVRLTLDTPESPDSVLGDNLRSC